MKKKKRKKKKPGRPRKVGRPTKKKRVVKKKGKRRLPARVKTGKNKGRFKKRGS